VEAVFLLYISAEGDFARSRLSVNSSASHRFILGTRYFQQLQQLQSLQ